MNIYKIFFQRNIHLVSRPSKSLGSLPVLYFGQKGVIIDTRYLKKL